MGGCDWLLTLRVRDGEVVLLFYAILETFANRYIASDIRCLQETKMG